MRRRRLTTALLSLLLSIVAFAAQKNLDKDITMVTYEQGWMDMNGTLSLKNNTGVEVKNVVFLITYLDMSGNELDYEEFNKLVSIAPGKTKRSTFRPTNRNVFITITSPQVMKLSRKLPSKSSFS